MIYTALACGFVVSGLIVVLMMPQLIRFLHKIDYNQSVSEYSLEEFKQKAKTPTMGGTLFVLVPILVCLLIFPQAISDLPTLIVMMAYFGYALIGFIDDFIIVVQHDNRGLPAWIKFAMQLILAVLFYFLYRSHASLSVTIPFLGNEIELGSL